jgi:hypothetical protein
LVAELLCHDRNNFDICKKYWRSSLTPHFQDNEREVTMMMDRTPHNLDAGGYLLLAIWSGLFLYAMLG